MNILYSDESPFTGGPSIFLAGPTPRSSEVKSWRPEAVRILQELGFKGTVLVPERRDWTVKFEYTDQVGWEKAGLHHATVILFWVPRKLENMPALDTNVEFGFWMSEHPAKVVYGRPDTSERNRYLDWLFRDITGRAPINTLEATLRSAIATCESILKEPMSNVITAESPFFPKWLVSDQHFGESEKMFRIRNRHVLFSTVEGQNDFIVRRHNEVVGPDDIVWIVGDIVCKNNPEALPQIARLNGRKVLFRGNHDVFTDEQYAPYFEEIVAEGDGKIIEINGLQCWVTHYPSQGREDMFNIVGHVHSPWQFQLNMLNVGVDVHHFTPVPTADVPFWFKKITDFSDDDIYAAYAANNAAYRGKRGTAGVYFKK